MRGWASLVCFSAIVVVQPALAQGTDRWGLTVEDWKSLTGRQFRQKIDVKNRRAEIEKAAREGDVTAMSIAAGTLADTVWGAPDFVAARAFAEAAAKRGDARAMVVLGQLLVNGRGGAVDKEGAFAWFSKAADLGQLTGLANLGVMFEQGYGTEKNLAKAVSVYRRSADAGDPSGLYLLGASLWKGSGVAKNLPAAFETMRLAAEAGSPEGMFWYGVWLNDPEINPDPIDLEGSTAWIGQSAEAGLADGIYYYGLRLKTGSGITADPVTGAAWLKRGADAGDRRAQFDLAYMLTDDQSGIEVDRSEGMRMFRAVAEDASSPPDLVQKAWFNLGALSQGTGDFTQAKSLYLRARAAGYAEADKALTNLAALQQQQAAQAQQLAAAQARAVAAEQAAKARKAAEAIGPSDAEISAFFVRHAARMSEHLQVSNDGALVVKNQFNSEIFRVSIEIRDRLCTKLSAVSYRCVYSIIPIRSRGSDGSLSSGILGLSDAFSDAFFGDGATLKSKANKLNQALSLDRIDRADVFVKGKGGYESKALGEYIWGETMVCFGRCDPKL